jgi:hypothetical protein
MALSFENIWIRVRNELQIGQVIKNWGNARGFTGNTFQIIGITEKIVECVPPKAKNSQKVPKGDFEKLWGIWQKYITDEILRNEIGDMSRYSSYIISIFHHLGK